jgi:hypothetical protein
VSQKDHWFGTEPSDHRFGPPMQSSDLYISTAHWLIQAKFIVLVTGDIYTRVHHTCTTHLYEVNTIRITSWVTIWIFVALLISPHFPYCKTSTIACQTSWLFEKNVFIGLPNVWSTFDNVYLIPEDDLTVNKHIYRNKYIERFSCACHVWRDIAISTSLTSCVIL